MTKLPRKAVALVAGRGISSLGSALTSFGLDIWIFRRTGSYAIFASLAMLATLPPLLFSPFAGVIADRFNKKWLLAGCEIASLCAVVVMLAMHLSGALNVGAIGVAILIFAIASETRWAVMSATITLVAGKEHRARLNGLQQAFRSATVLMGPVLGAIGFDLLGLSTLLAADAVTYVVAVATLATLSVPAPTDSFRPPAFTSFFNELTYGFRWVFERPGLRRLLCFFMLINVGVSVFGVTLAPYVLSFASNRTLAIGVALEGGGGILMGLWIARSRVAGSADARVVAGAAAFGVAMILWGICRLPVGLWSIAFIIGLAGTLVGATSQSIWQGNVPASIQGKVFAVRTVVSFGLTPIAILVSVPVADVLFRHALKASPILARLWGDSTAGALGLLVSTLGFAVAAGSFALIARGGLKIADSSNPAPKGDEWRSAAKT